MGVGIDELTRRYRIPILEAEQALRAALFRGGYRVDDDGRRNLKGPSHRPRRAGMD